MTDNKNAVRKKIPETLLFALELLGIILLAFCAALSLRRSAGIVAMTPIAFIICAVASFININPFIKTLIFTLTVFAVNTVEQSDRSVVFTFVALCLLANIVAESSAFVIRKGKKYGFAIAAVGAVLCITLSFIFVGNPFSAFKAQKTINDYTDKKYPESENAALGDFEFSNLYYRFDTKAYAIDAVSSKYPTENAMISVSDGIIRDGFSRLMEAKLREPYSLEFTAFLREQFPKDNFSVTCESIATLPNETVITSAEGTLYPKLTYEIHLGGIQGANEMLERVKLYMEAIDASDFEYNELIFKGGSNPWIRRCVKIENGRPEYSYEFKLEYVHSGISDEFSEYIKTALDDN